MNSFVAFVYSLSVINKAFMIVVPQDPDCSQPLGLESGAILDNAISAPQKAVQSAKEGYYARLNNRSAWCIPNSPGSKDSVFNEDIYITIDLKDQYQITALSLQGHRQYDFGQEIKISYDIPSYGFLNYKSKNGNTNIPVQKKSNDDYQYLILDQPISTSKIKLYLLIDANTKCLRMELYGCKILSVLKEYVDCPNKSNAVLTEKFSNSNLFNSTAFNSEILSYTGLSLLFSQQLAWCLIANKNNQDKFAEYTTINLVNQYILYGLQVDGLKGSTQYLAYKFKLDFSNDGQIWAKYNGGMEFISSEYQTKTLEFDVPISAKFLRIRMQEQLDNRTCIKLQVYGCQAILKEDAITTTLIPSTNTNTSTITPIQHEARIQFYKIKVGNYYQGLLFNDVIYNGQPEINNELDKGTGCLVDRVEFMTNPFIKPSCWLGWHKKEVPRPFILITLTRISFVNGIKLKTYINESAKASPIRRFYITSNILYDVLQNPLYACTPDSVYALSSQFYEFVLDIGKLEFHYLKVELDYSGDWILVRQIELILGELPKNSIKMTPAAFECVVPTKRPESLDGTTSSNTIVIIIVILMAVLLILLTAFILYRYGKNLRRIILKPPKSKPIIVRTRYGRDEVLIHGREDSSRSTLRSLYNNDLNCNEDVYAAPEKLSDQPGYIKVNVQYAQYAAPDDGNKDGTIHYADAKQYAEPNSVPPSNLVYQSSAIYASTYENPYKAVIASSLYSDPAKWTKQKTSIKIFPRSQLTFKERIGVGQFGEVHIAEARGLDEIYGTIGHYNSWGLADTALVAVKMLKSKDENITSEFLKEVEIMSRLKHENVVRLLGVCNYDASSLSSDKLMVVEYMENGDLNQYLRDRRPYESIDNVRISQVSSDALLPDQLLHIAEQIAAGVKYLHSEGFVHRDLATRNCLVGPALQVKIADFGMSRYLYSKHYYRIEGKAVLPIRWMAPESLFYGKFTQETDVWSFGVTLWEILTFARQSPYENLTDQQVISKACEAVQNPNTPFPILSKPAYCQPEIYAIICKCWDKNAENRPTFTFLHRFFKEIVNSVEMAI